MRLAAVLSAILAVGVACAAPAGAAAKRASHHRKPALKMIWGPNTLPDGSSAFPTYQRLGVDVLEEQLNWARVALSRPANPRDPADPAYRWPAALDDAVRQADAAHIKVSLMVKETPSWANGGRTVDRAPDSDADYTDFLRAAARRYPSVHFWMIWGEPTRQGNFSPMSAKTTTGPRRYARLVDASYAVLKSISRSNIVIGGNTWTVGVVPPPVFVRRLRLPDGKPPRMDYWGHNPFSTRFPRLSRSIYVKNVRDISDIDTLHQEIARAYRKRKVPKLWLSEFTVTSDRATRAFDFFVSRAMQAKWVTAAFALVDSVSYVAGLGWYDLYDESPVTPVSLTNGLMDAAGNTKPAFDAYRRAP